MKSYSAFKIFFKLFIGVWLIHFIIIVIVGAYTLIKSKNDKIKKKQLKEERAEQSYINFVCYIFY